MDFKEFEESIHNVPYSNDVTYDLTIMWPHRERLPLGVLHLGDAVLGIVKIPSQVVNKYGNTVPVIAISCDAFAGNDKITDLVLPQNLERIPEEAFMGCISLKRITIPRKVEIIEEGAFKGCSQLEDVYYEGTMEEWEKINIVNQRHEIEFGDIIPGTPVYEVKAERLRHIPGNEPLLSANIHFRCKLPEQNSNYSFSVMMGNKDITDTFRTIR